MSHRLNAYLRALSSPFKKAPFNQQGWAALHANPLCWFWLHVGSCQPNFAAEEKDLPWLQNWGQKENKVPWASLAKAQGVLPAPRQRGIEAIGRDIPAFCSS